MAIVLSEGVRVTVTESPNRDLGKVSEWCDISGAKFNACKTKKIMVSRSHTMNPQSPPLTIGRTVLKESADLDKLGVYQHLCSVSAAASQ